MSTDHESTDDGRPDLPQEAPPTAAGDDLMTSWLRTTVPTLWGASITAALAAIGPRLPDWLADPLGAALGSETTTLLVTVTAVAGWHGVWRRLESRVPRWLARAALGSSRPPTYAQRGSPGSQAP